MPDLLLDHAGSSKTALVDGVQRVSYAELIERSRSFAALLVAEGLQPGDRVAIFLRRSAPLVSALFGTHLAGGVAVIVNEKLRAAQVRYIVDHAEATLFVSDDTLLAGIPGFDAGAARLIHLDRVETPEGSAFERVHRTSRDLAMLIYTSGSTGMPKGIMLSHGNLIEGTQTVSDYLGLTDRDVLISLLPFTFDYGLNQLLSALRVGATLVLQRSMFPPDICRTLQREEITGMAGVPLLWSQLGSRLSPFTKRELPHLRYLTNSGGAFPSELVPVFRKAHPQTDLFLMYGLTEAFRSTYLPPSEVEHRPDSMGRAIPDVEILVVDDDGRECGPGEIGELVHRGAHVSLGYWRDPQTTAKVFRPHPWADFGNGREETVVYSGDLVRRDDEGYLYFIGRKDQMIKSHGVRVSPEEVEYYLRASEMLTAVAVFAVSRDGHPSIVAAVIPKSSEAFEADALIDYCRREMPEYMHPADIVTLDEFPETTTGKPDRAKLREAYLGE